MLTSVININLSVFVIIIYSLILTSCNTPEKVCKKTKFLLDTVCEITVVSPDTRLSEKIIDHAYSEIERVDHICGYESNSEVSQINASSGKNPVKVSFELVELIQTAINISNLTNGAFDVTIAPVINLWGFEKEKKQVPISTEIKKNLLSVNYKNIILDKKYRRKNYMYTQ